MEYLGVSIDLKHMPKLDPGFIPFGVWASAYEKGAERPFKIAVERENGLVTVYETKLRGPAFAEANYRYAERCVKMLLWSVGGWRVYLCGDDAIAKRMQDEYRAGGKREFDVGFMQDVYERPFEIVLADEAGFPQAHEQTRKVGGHTNGCRIGFDAGGSDRKVSAVIDGQTVYSEEVVWHPKTSEDPQYQYDGIVDAFKTAASKMPRVDGIGVSSAGVFIGNAPMVSSIFLKVPRSRREEVKTIFDRAAKEIGNVPIVVANDGDVSALAGAMSLHEGAVMGLAMGTSEAVGYVNADSNLLGWFSELAFAPVDLNEHAMRDEWSGDIGVGCKYFSQDAVIKLAPAAGIALAERLTPAEKKTYFKFLAFRLTQMSPVLCKRVAAGDPKASEDQEYVRVMRGLYAAMDKDLLQDFLSARSRAVLAEIRAFPAVAKVSGEKEREGRDAMNAALEARLAALPEGERTALKAGLTDPMKASAENTCRAFGFYLSTIASLTGEAGDNYVSTAVNRLAGRE